ncbi:MAG: ABC transporter ATP-binding protein [Synergistaceae bacterium]|nr:ABC transporter ATP-binding protein [Synergistaceae bacterium]MBP9626791.1 ABC transporter ATP-binding protein [Synergistaceae bacterium]MBP9957688.1 ABC transporter ATP-binding protein [Synergistaceae bacterium]
MPDILLAIKKLSIHFGGLRAIDDISFDVKKSEILGLLGPNGAGKTTCFNAISGVYKPTAGEILLEETRIDGLTPYQVAAMGIGRTFQIVKPFAGLTVLENVIIPLGLDYHRGNILRSFVKYGKKTVVDEAKALLDRVGLADQSERKAGLLPIGNLRRLEIARALALKPKILLLDESFSGLRHHEITQIELLVRGIKERGISVLLIEHNMKVAMNLSDRIVVLDHGNKLAEGLPCEIASNQAVIEAYLGKGESGRVA